MARKNKKKSYVRMRLTSGGKSNRRLMPIRTKQIKKTMLDPTQIPASKADIDKLINVAEWPPLATRDIYGIKLKEAHAKLGTLMNSSPSEFNREFTDTVNKLAHYGAVYQQNLINKLTGSNQNTAINKAPINTEQPVQSMPPPSTSRPRRPRTTKKVKSAKKEGDSSSTEYYTPRGDTDDEMFLPKRKYRIQRI